MDMFFICDRNFNAYLSFELKQSFIKITNGVGLARQICKIFGKILPWNIIPGAWNADIN